MRSLLWSFRVSDESPLVPTDVAYFPLRVPESFYHHGAIGQFFRMITIDEQSRYCKTRDIFVRVNNIDLTMNNFKNKDTLEKMSILIFGDN
jgi:hypothetical protein